MLVPSSCIDASFSSVISWEVTLVTGLLEKYAGDRPQSSNLNDLGSYRLSGETSKLRALRSRQIVGA